MHVAEVVGLIVEPGACQRGGLGRRQQVVQSIGIVVQEGHVGARECAVRVNVVKLHDAVEESIAVKPCVAGSRLVVVPAGGVVA